jgi:hypothetical protein
MIVLWHNAFFFIWMSVLKPIVSLAMENQKQDRTQEQTADPKLNIQEYGDPANQDRETEIQQDKSGQIPSAQDDAADSVPDARSEVRFVESLREEPRGTKMQSKRADIRSGRVPGFSVRRFLATHTGRGTLLIDRNDLGKLTREQWESFYVAAHNNPSFRFVVYGEEDAAVSSPKSLIGDRRHESPEKTSGDDSVGRLNQLSKLKNVVRTRAGAKEALKHVIPNRQSVFISAEELPEEIVRALQNREFTNVKGVRLGQSHEPIWLAVLYAASDGNLRFLTMNGPYLEDSRGIYADKIREHFLSQVIAWSA